MTSFARIKVQEAQQAHAEVLRIKGALDTALEKLSFGVRVQASPTWDADVRGVVALIDKRDAAIERGSLALDAADRALTLDGLLDG